MPQPADHRAAGGQKDVPPLEVRLVGVVITHAMPPWMKPA